MLITAENLILIGYEQSKENPDQYIRGNEMWGLAPSMVGFMNRVLANKQTEEESKASGEAYLKFKERTEKEIREKLGK